MQLKRRKLMSIIVSAVMLITVFQLPLTGYAEDSSSGIPNAGDSNCGPKDGSGYSASVNWSLDKDGVLTITGTGDMADWPNGNYVPWKTKPGYNVTEVIIDEGVTSIGEYAFNQCGNLTRVKLPSTLEKIDRFAFYGCYNLTYIEIPDNVQSIEGNAFQQCTKLETATFSDDSKVESIGNNAFYECRSLTDINIPDKITFIDWATFYGCTSLETVYFPNSLKRIGNSAFSGCSSLTSINLPEGTEYIEGYSFDECTALEEIVMPASVTTIESGAFRKCESITTAGPASGKYKYTYNWTTEIPDNAFSGLGGLKSVELPTTITKIGANAFEGCYSIEKILFMGSEKYWNENVTIGTDAIPDPEVLILNGYCYLNGHSWDTEYTVDRPATCTEPGIKSRHCLMCDSVKEGTQVELPALGHDEDYGKVYVTTTKATFGKAGVKTSTCSLCKGTKTAKIPALKTPTLSTSTYTYNGSTKSPSVVIKDATGKTVSSANYTVKTPAGRKNAGKYTYQITFKNDYAGTASLTMTIKPVKLTSVALSTTAYTFNGKVKTPLVTAKAGSLTAASKATKDSSSVDLTYASGRKNVGTYKVTVKGKGNYTGTISKTFKINPAGKSISKLTAAKKAFTVKWSKPSSTYRKQMTGYQIRYSTSSKMTSSKTVTVKSTTATSKKISKLKAKKKYYVQIRTYKTVKGVKYYSSWSKAKSVKTK